MGLTLAGAIGGLVYPGDRTPARAVFETALTVFLVWALARELDPDRPATASIAAVLGGAAALWTGDTSIVGLTGVMLASRILVRTTGAAPLLTDVLWVGVFVGALARDAYAWAAGLAAAAALALDTSLPHPAPGRRLWLAGAIGLSVTLTAVLSGAMPDSWQPPSAAVLAVAVIATVAVLTARSLPLVSTDDRRRPLDPARLRSGRLLVASALMLATLAGGTALGAATVPAWMAVAATGVASHTSTS